MPKSKKYANTNCSCYFITINTHVSPNNLNEEEKKEAEEKLENLTAAILADPTDFIIFKVNGGNASRVCSIENYTKIEYQDDNKSHQLHSHSYYRIKHSTVLQLDYKKLESIISSSLIEAFGINPKVHIQRASNEGDGELVYMEKGTHTEWSKKDVSLYYKKLKEDRKEEGWDNFTRHSKRRKMTLQEDEPQGDLP